MWGSDARALGVRLDGSQIDETDEHGNPVVGDTLFVLFSADDKPVLFAFPRREPERRWERLLDTSDARWARRIQYDAAHYELTGRSTVVFRLAEPPVNGGLV